MDSFQIINPKNLTAVEWWHGALEVALFLLFSYGITLLCYYVIPKCYIHRTLPSEKKREKEGTGITAIPDVELSPTDDKGKVSPSVEETSTNEPHLDQLLDDEIDEFFRDEDVLKEAAEEL